MTPRSPSRCTRTLLDSWRTIGCTMVAGIASPERRIGQRPEQDIRFCLGHQGARIAWAVHGSGPPVIVVSCWLSHLQHDWRSPVWRHFLEDLGAFATLVRYDERGFGMSDWDVTDFSLGGSLR